jgi:hypothetical protein
MVRPGRLDGASSAGEISRTRQRFAPIMRKNQEEENRIHVIPHGPDDTDLSKNSNSLKMVKIGKTLPEWDN